MAEEKETIKEADDIALLISVINPLYSSNPDKIKEFLKKEDFWKTVEKAKKEEIKPKERDAEKETDPETHELIYQSSAESLEPVYFWTLDLMSQLAGKVEKLVDNFTSSPGSGHFSELMGKATRMQEEAMKILGSVNTVIKSIINIIYDLKEFELRLSQYKAAASKDKEEAEAGLLSLKQIWMDNVDIKRGRGSINMLAQDLNFVTIRDAFMIAKSVEDIKKMDLNERVKRILEPRIQEFLKWRELSEKQLRTSYGVEKTYLKSQVNALQLYTRWAKPYLKAASQLEQKEVGRQPALVTAFNTILLELTLLGKKELKFEEAIVDKKLPDSFRHTKLKRKYYSCILVDFYFRGIPERVGTHYAFGGKSEVTFRAYALNEEELAMLNKRLEESDLNDALKLVSGVTEDSLVQLKEDLDYFLKEPEEKEKEEKEKKVSEDINPFSALFGLGKKKEKQGEDKGGEKKEIKEIKSDNYVEKTLRELAQKTANEICFNLFDIYKKAHDMPSHPSPVEFTY